MNRGLLQAQNSAPAEPAYHETIKVGAPGAVTSGHPQRHGFDLPGIMFQIEVAA